MNIDITSGITGFFSIFTSVYTWLDNLSITIGSITFSFIDLIVSILVVSMMINFIFAILRSD